MKNHRSKTVFVGLLMAAALGGCGGGYVGGGRHPVYQSDVDEAAGQALEARVRNALASDVRVGAESLTVKAQGDGVIELGGNPKDLRARDLAIEITRRVRGVRTVLNNMVL